MNSSFRLIGERGIPALPKIFKNIDLKGKHHEVFIDKNLQLFLILF